MIRTILIDNKREDSPILIANSLQYQVILKQNCLGGLKINDSYTD